MRKFLIIMISLVLAVSAFATTISDIQQGTVAEGTAVTVSGVVTVEPYALGGDYMFIQDGTGPWSGLYIKLGANISSFVGDTTIVAEGDSVTISGTTHENYGMTRLKDVTAVVVEQAGVGCPAPLVLSAADAKLEEYESVLVSLKNVAISNPDKSYGEWEVCDATDSVMVDDEGQAPYYFWQDEYDSLISITGVMNYSYDNPKILPRLAWDIIEGPLKGGTKIYTRIQRIQQVRASDLMKALKDGESDKSYFDEGADRDNPADTTFHIKGVVTMPTGLSYAGDGVKFILSDVHGGPWSCILSYNQDASVYPDLFATDLIEMSGYVGEYSTSPANMTEFFLVGDVNVVGVSALPDTAVVTTGDLRIPLTAEQWGNNIVKIENALVVNNTPQYEIMGIDDGSGDILVDSDSDSLEDYLAPPVMTPIESVTGWIYHHYGSHVDSTTYKIEPLYKEDIVLGEGPAMLLNPSRTPANIPTPTQTVTANVLISTLRNIDTAKIYYKVNDGDFTSVNMTESTGNIWTGVIPAQADDAIVEYYYYVVDDSSDVSALPSNYEESNYFTYKVIDGNVSVYDIQYTHAASGKSPLDGCNVTFDAYMMSDGADMATFKNSADKCAFPVASATGAWNGVWVLAPASEIASLVEGDLVTVTGKVDDDHEAYWKYQTNTYVDGSVSLKLSEGPLGTTPATLAELEANPESFEGVLVELEAPLVIGSINSYDLTLTDGTNSFLLDDDCVADSVMVINYEENVVVGNDTLVTGDSLAAVKGVVMYSYGSIKIEVRKNGDVTLMETPPDAISDIPSSFALHQNFPNPFNPVTTIRFELASATDVKLSVYDISGRLVEELVNTSMNAGAYDLRWNAAHLSSGMYLYRIETPEFTATNKLVLLK